MTNPDTTAIHADIGLAWSTIEGTTTTVVGRLLSKAQTDIKHVTGTTTGDTQDRAIRSLTDAYSVNNALANLDPNKDNMIAFTSMRSFFLKDADNALRTIGKSLDGITIQFTQVNP